MHPKVVDLTSFLASSPHRSVTSLESDTPRVCCGNVSLLQRPRPHPLLLLLPDLFPRAVPPPLPSLP